VSALLIAMIAATVAAWAGLRASHYARDRRDEQWATDWITQLRAMRGAAHWPAGDDELEDRAVQAEALCMCELDQRRLERTIRHHPAGGAQ
jgi:hypothetical protein